MKKFQIRQGDVLVSQVAKLPEGLKDVTPQGDIILAYGEVTGHAHRIRNDVSAAEIAANAIGLAARRARLWEAANGARYLEVSETVSLTHEEHTAHEIPPGFYTIPTQVEYVAGELQRVAD